MEDLPLGFGMALAQRSEAMQRFCALTDEEQHQKTGLDLGELKSSVWLSTIPIRFIPSRRCKPL